MRSASSSPPASAKEALILGLSLYGLPSKLIDGTEYPPVDRVHAHIAWMAEGRLCSGTVPIGHPYPIGHETSVIEDFRKRYPIGSILPYEETSGEVREKGPERAVGDRVLATATIVGWFLVLNLGKDAETPFLSRFLVGRTTTADGLVRGRHIKAERGADIWPLKSGESLISQVRAAGADLIWRNDAGAAVEYAATRGGYWQALVPRVSVPADATEARGA